MSTDQTFPPVPSQPCRTRAASYGRAGHTVEKKKHEMVFIPGKQGLPAMRLRSGVRFKVENGRVSAEFKLKPDHTASFVLDQAEGESPSAKADHVSDGRFEP